MTNLVNRPATAMPTPMVALLVIVLNGFPLTRVFRRRTARAQHN
jgi:hypothetical protein